MEAQRKLEDVLKNKGLIGKSKTMVEGAPATERWADQVGVDAYVEDTGEVVNKAKQLLGIN
jgi:trimethylamine corrinoid protein